MAKSPPEEKEKLGWSNTTWIARRGAPIDLPVEVELRFADGTSRREIVRFGPFAPSKHPGNGEWRRIEHPREAPARQRYGADDATKQPAY